ncbi:MAG: TIM barrel protein [Chitinophagaceae bacterium]
MKRLAALQLLRYAGKNDIGVVQLGDNLPLHELGQSALGQIKSLADTKGIKLETGTRRLTLKNIEEYINISAYLESPFLRIVIDDKNYHPSTADVIKIIKKTLPSLQKNNIVLAIENHDRFPAAELRKIILKTDPKWVGICLDTANSLGAGEGINEVLQSLAPYTINLHIKDILIKRVPHKMGFTIEGVAAGDGMIDILSIIQQLKQTGRCKTATLEVWSNPASTMKETLTREKKMVKKSIQYLKKMIA